jgi:fido (protein-threonine AMPylation protein)
MCADILRIEGFEGINPQSPLGGADGGKDMLCSKVGMSFVVACYFPHQPLSFSHTRKKFRGDALAARKHGRDGFIFMTNQQLTPGERTELEVIAAKTGSRCLIYGCEHLRIVLDSPEGYGVRLRHLGIGMSSEEQAAYFASSDKNIAAALNVQTRAIDRVAARVDRFARENRRLMGQTVAAVAKAVRANRDEDVAEMLRISAKTIISEAAEDSGPALSANLSTPLLRYVHRLLLPGDVAFAGQYRQTQVWLTDPTGQVNADLECPAWDNVPHLMEELVTDWNSNFSRLEAVKAKGAVTDAMARFFHRMLWIHPFIDGNGRLARSTLALQGRDLLRLREDLRLDRGVAYYVALKSADGGDFSGLGAMIEASIKASR